MSEISWTIQSRETWPRTEAGTVDFERMRKDLHVSPDALVHFQGLPLAFGPCEFCGNWVEAFTDSDGRITGILCEHCIPVWQSLVQKVLVETVDFLHAG